MFLGGVGPERRLLVLPTPFGVEAVDLESAYPTLLKPFALLDFLSPTGKNCGFFIVSTFVYFVIVAWFQENGWNFKSLRGLDWTTTLCFCFYGLIFCGTMFFSCFCSSGIAQEQQKAKVFLGALFRESSIYPRPPASPVSRTDPNMLLILIYFS